MSVCGFYAEIEGKKIIGVCKEKEAAFNDYDDAIAGGHGGYLLDQGIGFLFLLLQGLIIPRSLF